MTKLRLDQALIKRGLTTTRSQANSYVQLGLVRVNDKAIKKNDVVRVSDDDKLEIIAQEQFVSRAGQKLSVAVQELGVNFTNKIVLDVGSSTGGFTDYSIRHGAKKVIAVELGSDQLHTSLRTNPNIELHEQTDIRNYKKTEDLDIILVDASFVSLKLILPTIYELANGKTEIVSMFKPQFEAPPNLKNKGIIKNNHIRRDLIKEFDSWLKANRFFIDKSVDSKIPGSKGNLEKFYLLKKI